MRKVTSVGQLIKATQYLMSVQPEDGAILMMFEDAIENGDTESIGWLVHNSDLYKVSGRLMGVMRNA